MTDKTGELWRLKIGLSGPVVLVMSSDPDDGRHRCLVVDGGSGRGTLAGWEPGRVKTISWLDISGWERLA